MARPIDLHLGRVPLQERPQNAVEKNRKAPEREPRRKKVRDHKYIEAEYDELGIKKEVEGSGDDTRPRQEGMPTPSCKTCT